MRLASYKKHLSFESSDAFLMCFRSIIEVYASFLLSHS